MGRLGMGDTYFSTLNRHSFRNQTNLHYRTFSSTNRIFSCMLDLPSSRMRFNVEKFGALWDLPLVMDRMFFRGQTTVDG